MHNYRNVRQKMEEVKPGEGLPFVGMSLAALTAIEEANPPTVDVEGHILINFERYWMIADQIKSIKMYQTTGCLQYGWLHLRALTFVGGYLHSIQPSAPFQKWWSTYGNYFFYYSVQCFVCPFLFCVCVCVSFNFNYS